MTTLSDLIAKQDQLRLEMVQHGKAAVTEELAGFFAKYPDMRIGWCQYTPYFNDGEACVFSLHGINLIPPGAVEDEEDEGYVPGEWELCSLSYHASKADRPEWLTDELIADCEAINKKLYAAEETLEYAFGDHVEVIADKVGVTVNDYDHD
jgi:hypothetical protein